MLILITYVKHDGTMTATLSMTYAKVFISSAVFIGNKFAQGKRDYASHLF